MYCGLRNDIPGPVAAWTAAVTPVAAAQCHSAPAIQFAIVMPL
jgi:hypothetical protein